MALRPRVILHEALFATALQGLAGPVPARLAVLLLPRALCQARGRVSD